MGGIFGGSGSLNTGVTKFTALRIQTSVYGICIPILYGRNRVPPNLIWYGDFKAKKHKQQVGKGGGQEMIHYTYTCYVMMGLCEGPIGSVENVWWDKKFKDIAETEFFVVTGDYPQPVWDWLTEEHPDQALSYPGLALVAAAKLKLGNSPNLPNLNFDCLGLCRNVTGWDDADPADIIPDFLSNAHYGAGFPAARLKTLTQYSNYCRAAGLLVSPFYSSAQPANQILQDLVDLTNADFVWSEGMLDVIAFGDVGLAANGAVYTPILTAVADLTDDDFLYAEGEDPVQVSRSRPADAYNRVTLEYANRLNQYNPEPIAAEDMAAIELYGLRPEDTKEAHVFCDAQAAQTAAQLRVQGFLVRNTYKFSLDQRHIGLDPGDIVTITDSILGLDQKRVRITEIAEDEELRLAVTAVELIQGTRSAEAYPYQAVAGYGSDLNADPGAILEPLIFEPKKKLVDRPQIWICVAGGSQWGGCNVWASVDGGTSYSQIGTIFGGACYGELSAELANHADPDTENTLSVDLSQSHGELFSVTTDEADVFATLCLVGNEYIAYRDAELTSQYNYDLTYLRRGANESNPAHHNEGVRFAFLDGRVFRYPYAQKLINKGIYLKFTSFNLHTNREQSLDEVDAYLVTPDGTSVPTGYGYDPDGLIADIVN